MNSTTTKPKLKTSAMIASFADPGQKTASAPFGHALAALGETDQRVVGLSADLAKYTDMHIFRDAHPDRFFQMGMAEQLLFGAAAGMAEVGLIPFASTYSVFAARRAYDFICLDIAEPGLNVNIVGGLPGLTTGYGPSHQATEDVAIFRDVDLVSGECFGCLQRAHRHQPAGDEHDIGAGAQHLRLAELEGVVVLV